MRKEEPGEKKGAFSLGGLTTTEGGRGGFRFGQVEFGPDPGKDIA